MSRGKIGDNDSKRTVEDACPYKKRQKTKAPELVPLRFLL